MTDNERFKQDLLALGVDQGDTVLVHSSMKALQTDCTPEEIICDITEVLGDDGTLLMPALTYENVTPDDPVFDSASSEPCVGLLPRVFMREKDVLRSVNPTHSVFAKGRLSHVLTVGHCMDNTAVGPHSPFMLLPLYKGKILFIGDILESCTLMHGVESIVMPPYIRQVRTDFTVNGEKREYIINDTYGWGSEFPHISR